MNKDLIMGLLVMIVPLVTLGYMMLRNQTSIFRFFLAMLVIGIGYLTAVGAVERIGAAMLSKLPYDFTHTVAPKDAAAPAATPASAPAPAAKDAAPAGQPAPAGAH